MSKIAFIAFLACSVALAASGAASADSSRPEELCDGVLLHQNGPLAVTTGEVAVYEIRVTNAGPCQIDDAVLTDFVPRRATFVEAIPPATVGPAPIPTHTPGIQLPVERVEWPKIALRPGESSEEKFLLKVRIEGTGRRVMTNTACLEHEFIGRLCDSFDTYVK
ncbi:MAG: DUF11 domain-containing protein [Oligoflexia bacterium]|nr:DUF11 domain-containing protein [Oligoflexia bacterium]